MANANFTRDEVILTLDVLYSASNNRISPNSNEMHELSELLKRLPIHASDNKRANFRTATGITQQVKLFLKSCKLGEKNVDVGKRFFEVAFEYEDKPEQLHAIASAIRANEKYFTATFGAKEASYDFPEGALLGHLHHIIEHTAQEKYDCGATCEICGIKPMVQYKLQGNLLQLHLLIPPEKLNGGTNYGQDCYMTVCPTCHAVLHRIRPWVVRENCGNILR